MNLSPKYLISLLEKNGFVYKRTKGSHNVFYNPIRKITVVVPVHGGKDMNKFTFMGILKQAGIELK